MKMTLIEKKKALFGESNNLIIILGSCAEGIANEE
jgi:hypothetical protein